MPKLQTLILLVSPQSSLVLLISYSAHQSLTLRLSVSQTICLLHSLRSQPTTANTHPKQPAAQLNHSVSGVCVAAFLASSSPAQSRRSRSRSSQQLAPCLDVVIFLLLGLAVSAFSPVSSPWIRETRLIYQDL